MNDNQQISNQNSDPIEDTGSQPSQNLAYEIMAILSGALTDQEAQIITDQIESIIIELGGLVSVKQPLDRKRLSYPIAHQQYGVYSVVEFQLNPGLLARLADKLRNINNILRHQVVHALPKETPRVPRAERTPAPAPVTAAEPTLPEEVTPAHPHPTLEQKELDKTIENILDDKLF